MNTLDFISAFVFMVGATFGIGVVAIVSYISGSLETGLVGLITGIFLIGLALVVEIIYGNRIIDLITLDANASGMFYVVSGIGSGALFASIPATLFGLIARMHR